MLQHYPSLITSIAECEVKVGYAIVADMFLEIRRPRWFYQNPTGWRKWFSITSPEEPLTEDTWNAHIAEILVEHGLDTTVITAAGINEIPLHRKEIASEIYDNADICRLAWDNIRFDGDSYYNLLQTHCYEYDHYYNPNTEWRAWEHFTVARVFPKFSVQEV